MSEIPIETSVMLEIRDGYLFVNNEKQSYLSITHVFDHHEKLTLNNGKKIWVVKKIEYKGKKTDFYLHFNNSSSFDDCIKEDYTYKNRRFTNLIYHLSVFYKRKEIPLFFVKSKTVKPKSVKMKKMKNSLDSFI